MRKRLTFAPLFLSLFPGLLLAAQTDHKTAFTGIWQLNVAKSTYPPEMAPHSLTLRFAEDGTTTISGVDARGKAFKWSFPWSGSKEVAVEGLDNTTAIQTFEGYSCSFERKEGGNTNVTAHAVRAADNKTMTGKVTYLDKKGKGTQYTEFYQRQ